MTKYATPRATAACLLLLMWSICFSTAAVAAGTMSTNNKPVLGILTEPTISSQCESLYSPKAILAHFSSPVFSKSRTASEYEKGAEDAALSATKVHFEERVSTFSTVYVKWAEMAGVRVVAIPYNADRQLLDQLFQGINGVLFTGGGLSLGANTTYFETAQYIYNKVLEENRKGNHFTLWGTCMGFQLLNILTSEDHSVLESGFDSYALGLALDYTAEAPSSRFLGSLPKKIYSILSGQPVTVNLHHDGVEPSVFQADARLSSFYSLLSTNKGRKGRSFVSTIEGKQFPVYGTQWHPERNQFEWKADDNITHTPDAMLAMQAVGNFLAAELRKSSHSFPKDSKVYQDWIIYSYAPIPTGDSYSCYFFKY